MSFIPTFGAVAAIQPSNASYQPIVLDEDVTLVWPLEQQDGVNYPAATFIDATPDAAGRVITMPDARQTGNGTTIYFHNAGADPYTVKDAGGGVLASIASGEVWGLLLKDNQTADGTWLLFQNGAGTSNANAASLAGAGLKAISTTLNQAMNFESKSGNYQIVEGDRSIIVMWTGGVGDFTLPEAATVGEDWFTIIKNMGSGTLTLKTPSGETIDGSATVSVGIADSCFVATDGTNYFTIGFGQAVNSQFDYISISIAGTGDYTLAGIELNRISYNLTGILTGNRSVIVPATVQQYWVQNNTTGAFTVTIKTAAGTGVIIPQGDSAIVFCNSVDVINAAESSSITFPLSIGQGGTGQTTAGAALTALGGVPTTRTITSGVGLTGGGDLSANRTLSVSLLGLETLTDPNADRILFWDDSLGETEWLQVSNGLSIAGTTLSMTYPEQAIVLPIQSTLSLALVDVTGSVVALAAGTYHITVTGASNASAITGIMLSVGYTGTITDGAFLVTANNRTGVALVESIGTEPTQDYTINGAAGPSFTTGTTNFNFTIEGNITVSTVGDFSLRFGKLNNDGQSVKMRAGAVLIIKRIA